MSIARWLSVLISLMSLVGCVSIPHSTGVSEDPWEPYNRAVNTFNETFDEHIGIPAAEGYQIISPKIVDRGVTNFFANLLDVNSAVNNLLQWKLGRAASDVGRVLINSTIGLLGFFDVASHLGVPSYKEDFGQTLGYWGVDTGPYFLLPILGPSTVRDTVGLIADVMINPLSLINMTPTETVATTTIYYVDMRADLLETVDLMKQAAIDPYAFTRDSYLQRRRSLVYDGSPPLSDDDPFEDELDEEME